MAPAGVRQTVKGPGLRSTEGHDDMVVIGWLASSLIRRFADRTLVILSLDTLATLCIAASLATLYNLYLQAPGEDLDLPILGTVQLTVGTRFGIVSLLTILGILGGASLYLSSRLSVQTAAEHFLAIHRTVFRRISSPAHSGWQLALLPTVTRNLKRAIGPGLKSVGRSTLVLLRMIKPALVLVVGAIALTVVAPRTTLILVPILALYLTVFLRLKRRTNVNQKNLSQQQRDFRALIGSAVRKIENERDGLPVTLDVPDATVLGIGKLYLHRKRSAEILRSLNTATLFLSTLVVFATLALGQPNEDPGRILLYFVLLTLCFGSLDSLLTNFFLLTRFVPDLRQVMKIVLPARKMDNYEQPGHDNPVAPKLALGGLDYATGKRSTLSIEPGNTLWVLTDEPVNRVTLPALCLLLERWIGAEPMSLLSRSAFVLDQVDFEEMRADSEFVFIAGVDEALSESRPESRHTFRVTDDLDRFLDDADDFPAPETLCLIVLEGTLHGHGAHRVMKQRIDEIRRSVRRARRRARRTGDDDDDGE